MIQVQQGIHVQRFASAEEATNVVFDFASSGRPLSRYGAIVMAEACGSVVAVIGERDKLRSALPFVARRIKKRLKRRDRDSELVTFLLEDGGDRIFERVVRAGERPRDVQIGGW